MPTIGPLGPGPAIYQKPPSWLQGPAILLPPTKEDEPVRTIGSGSIARNPSMIIGPDFSMGPAMPQKSDPAAKPRTYPPPGFTLPPLKHMAALKPILGRIAIYADGMADGYWLSKDLKVGNNTFHGTTIKSEALIVQVIGVDWPAKTKHLVSCSPFPSSYESEALIRIFSNSQMVTT